MTKPINPDAYKLSLFIGHWRGAGEVFPNPWGPDGACTGLWQFAYDDSGHHLVHDYRETRRNDFRFNGHGVFSLAPDTGEVLWFWFDSLGQVPIAPARGEWEDNMLTLYRETPRGVGRASFTFDHNRFGYELEMRLKGQAGFAPVMRGEFSRQLTTAAATTDT